MPTYVNGQRVFINNIIAYSIMSNFTDKTRTLVFARVIHLKPLIVNDLKYIGDKVDMTSDYVLPIDESFINVLDVSEAMYTDSSVPMELCFKKMFPQHYI